MNDSDTFFWLVGLFEGEASFGYKTRTRTPVIELEMTDEHIIARVASFFGITYCRRDRRGSLREGQNLRVSYRCDIGGARAMRLMKELQPYLSPRRSRQIDAVEAKYLAGRWNTIDYINLPLPSFKSVPFSVTRE